jgi:outer membrane protein assembly factor BamD
MYHKLIYIFIISFLLFSCSKKEPVVNTAPSNEERSFKIYEEAIKALDEGQYYYASGKFLEAENILTKIEFSAKASLMSSYCFYLINFYNEAEEGLERFMRKYPADKNIPYAYYLLVIVYYEQILDESKDITPLLVSKEKIEHFLGKYSDTEYALDLKFKLDLINNQLAAKELYVAKYYIETKKWIPAINRLKTIVRDYDETIFIEEALHRLVEVYYMVGLEEEAKTTAALLGYNYNSSEWYQQSYKLLNKDYKIPKKKIIKKDKDKGIIKRTIKKILG